MLIVLPHEISDTPIETKTRRGKRGRKASKSQERPVNESFCRAIAAARPEDADNSALSIFFVCPGAGRRSNGHEIEDYDCSVRDLTFADVVPCELDPVVRSLKFSSIFSLARMISIYENEVDVDKKRYLMRTPSYNFVSISGVEKAYTFFKRHCEHLLKTLLRHDGSNIAIIAKDAVDMELAQLNDLTNTGIRYAMTHSWEEISIEGPKKQTLIMVLNGFRGCARVLRAEDNVTISAYKDLKNAAATVRDHKDLMRMCAVVSFGKQMRPHGSDLERNTSEGAYLGRHIRARNQRFSSVSQICTHGQFYMLRNIGGVVPKVYQSTTSRVGMKHRCQAVTEKFLGSNRGVRIDFLKAK
ncbi:unnamed protein product [Heligmosomoides polygyrus]|uniref:Zeta_toxin domain-containing protein n=1 Tax=Heligmosomoides polygyrus TaxID=6339 RepID=A0A3P8DB26_HELPZ|nr:unnamed protein product [Heligmosomoides polygyrus]